MHFPVSSVLIEFLILAIIDRKHSYGYEISQTIKLVATIKESTLYPILKKMVEAGFVTTYQEEHQGRQRKYYAMTDLGREQLSYLKKEWVRHSDLLAAIIEGRQA